MKRLLIIIPIFFIALMLVAQTKPVVSKTAAIENGAKVYKQYCMSCHQADAAGVPYLNPPLIKTPFVLGGKKPLIELLIKGQTGPVEIQGETYTNPMPAQGLKDQEIADVLSYVRNNFGNKASMVSPAEVKQVRSAIK